MKTATVLTMASLALLSACRVSDSKKEDPKTPEEAPGVNIVDPTANFLGLLFNADQEEIYTSEAIELSWSSKLGSKCSIKANDTEIGKDLENVGSIKDTPTADTTYLLTCVNGDVTNTASLNLNPLSDAVVELPVSDKDEVSSFIDFARLSDECKDGKSCYFADLEKELFKKTSQGWVETQDFTKLLISTQSAFPAPKAITIDSVGASFDLTSSVVYGYQGDLHKLNLDQVCRANLPFAAGTSIPTDLTLSQTLSNGFEEISNGLMNVSVFTDLKIEGKERRSIIQKGSDLTATFFNTEIRAKVSGSYLDYGMANGKFIAKGRTERALVQPFSTSSAMLASDMTRSFNGEMFDVQRAFYPPVPAGYRLPAKGYGGDENAFIPTDMLCSVSRQRVDSGFMGSVQTWYGPVSDYFSRYSSKRIVKGPAAIQCNDLFAYDAKQYGIGADWKIDKEDTLWFVTDRNWPSCKGYDCIGKEMVISYGATFPLQEWEAVEPSYNFCIDRWAGIDFDPYIASIKSECYESDVYKAALQAHQTTEDDLTFYRKCSSLRACDDFVSDVGLLSVTYPPTKLRSLIKVAKARMEAAKASSQSYLITDKMFSNQELKWAISKISRIRENFSTYENLRVSVSSSVDGFSRYDFASPLEPEFKTSEGILKMMDEYDGLLEDVQKLGAVAADVVGCDFAANGRFRSYEGISVSDLKITPLSKITKTAPILRDIKVGE